MRPEQFREMKEDISNFEKTTKYKQARQREGKAGLIRYPLPLPKKSRRNRRTVQRRRVQMGEKTKKQRRQEIILRIFGAIVIILIIYGFFN